jgi:hypothetical protein
MNKAIAMMTIISLGLLAFATPGIAGEPAGTQISKILDYKTSLSLSDSQVKKLEIVQRTAQEKMNEARVQSEIRLGEVEKFTSNWTNMNSVAVMSLIKEYYKFLTDYKTAELEAVIRARSILDMNQLSKLQQLVSIESLMITMEQSLAFR